MCNRMSRPTKHNRFLAATASDIFFECSTSRVTGRMTMANTVTKKMLTPKRMGLSSPDISLNHRFADLMCKRTIGATSSIKDRTPQSKANLLTENTATIMTKEVKSAFGQRNHARLPLRKDITMPTVSETGVNAKMTLGHSDGFLNTRTITLITARKESATYTHPSTSTILTGTGFFMSLPNDATTSSSTTSCS